MSRTLIVIGLAIAAAGVLWPWISKLGLGRLPGDIMFGKIEPGDPYFDRWRAYLSKAEEFCQLLPPTPAYRE